MNSRHRLALSFSLMILLSGCTSGDSGEASANAVAADGNEAAAEVAAASTEEAAPSVSCVEPLRVDIHRESFDRGGEGPARSAEAFETLRTGAEILFRSVASGMCASGELDPAGIGAVRRLLVQNGAGADNVAIYADPDAFGPDALVFQYVFDTGDEAGTFALPDPADLREGLLCHFAPDEREATCSERMP